jgi:hypothetical protein
MISNRWMVCALATGLFTITAVAQEWKVTDSGAVGDGKTDCTAAFQQALDQAAKAGGGVVNVAAGRYRINGNLVIPGGVTLQGTFRSPPTSHLQGSILLAFAGRGNPKDKPFIRLGGPNATVAGIIITYPEWKQSDVPPIPYPPCIYARDAENTAVLDCLLLNPYEGIRMERAARHLVRNVYGYPIYRGFSVDECYDIGRVENCHFWPFGVNYNQDDPYCKWINVNGVAFEFARTDWHYVYNTFCFGYGVGYKFSESKAGACNGNFLGIGADCCRRAVLVEQAQEPGLLITNGEFVGRWGSEDSVCLEIAESSGGKVSLTNCSFWGPIDRCVWMRAAGAQFTANATHFLHWDNHNQDSAAVQLDAGKAIIQGSTFGNGETCVFVGPNVKSAILMGNHAADGFNADNQAGTKTQIIGNEGQSVQWTDEARAYYQIDIGAEGDGRYVRLFHGQEKSSGQGMLATARWSGAQSRLILPTLKDTDYTLILQVAVPAHAIDDKAGIYQGDKRIAEFKADAQTLTVNFRSGSKDPTVLEIRCKGWIPRKVLPGNQDDRTLGIQLFGVTAKAKTAGTKRFSANTGLWN